MESRNTSDQVDRLLQALSAIPGSTAFDVKARTYPRFWPPQMEATFQEIAHGFPADQLPDALGLPEFAEEIHITLHGKLPAPPTASELMEWAMDALKATECGRNWDVRAHVANRSSENAAYHLTVFTRSESSPSA